MDERLAANKVMWDEWTDIHVESDFYDVERFRSGINTLHDLERAELGDVNGKSLLHLQCHFGLDTMSWSRLGALATGVDFSTRSIATANALAQELRLDTRFICSDVYGLPNRLEEKFDVVFTSYGVLTWLPDLDEWASVITHFLRDGGTFYIAEIHPGSGIYDYDKYPLEVARSYFRDGPEELTETGSYVDRKLPVAADRQYQWLHSMGTILTSLTNAGLQIEYVHEFPFCSYRRYDVMTYGEDGWWHLPDEYTPMTFTIRATKP